MKMQPIRIAVLGAGMIGRRHLSTILKRPDLVELVGGPGCSEAEFFERVRGARQTVPDLGAKRSHNSGYGEHLQRRASAFWCDERA